uniref:O-acetyl-ADP-ribose deacetylase MACROD2 n=1 Tax=Amazona collaria TaxID=241587 RepID=A0A8B9FUV8_9PSIT
MYPGNKRKKLWREEKERLLKMTLEERRKEYLREYVALKNIPTWMEDLKSKGEGDGETTKEDLQGKKSLSEKVSLYRGDITLLEVDAIVNAEVILVTCQYFQGYLKSLVELPTLETGEWCSPSRTRTFSAAVPGEKKCLQPVICESSIVKESLFYPEYLSSRCKLSLSLYYIQVEWDLRQLSLILCSFFCHCQRKSILKNEKWGWRGSTVGSA